MSQPFTPKSMIAGQRCVTYHEARVEIKRLELENYNLQIKCEQATKDALQSLIIARTSAIQQQQKIDEQARQLREQAEKIREQAEKIREQAEKIRSLEALLASR